MAVVTKSKREQKDFCKCNCCVGTDLVSQPFLCKVAQLYIAFEVFKYLKNMESEEKKNMLWFELEELLFVLLEILQSIKS